MLIGAFLVLTLVATPLAFPPTVFSGSVDAVGQTPAFRALLLTAAVAFGAISLVLVSPSSARLLVPKSGTLSWSIALTLLILWLTVSLVSEGLAPVVPAYGATHRMDGALVQGAWFVLLLITYLLVCQSQIRVGAVSACLTVTAVLTSAWTFLQGVGRDPLTTLTGLYLDVPAGAFGHGALAGAFVAFVLLILVWQWSRPNARLSWQLLVTVLLGLGIAAAGGRAAVVGLVVGLAIVFVNFALKRRPVRRAFALVAALTCGMAIGLLSVPRAQSQAHNMTEAVSGQDAALNARFASWKGGLRLLAEYPLFGVGPGGFGYGVWPHLSASEAEVMIRDPLGGRLVGVDLAEGTYVITGNVIATTDSEGQFFVSSLGWDKAHNYVLDLALTAGIPAAVFFLAFVLASLSYLWRSSSRFAQGTAIALVSFLVFGQAWFPTISLDPVIWATVGAGLGFANRASMLEAEPALQGRTKSTEDDAELGIG